jgi:hypothetical protein
MGLTKLKTWVQIMSICIYSIIGRIKITKENRLTDFKRRYVELGDLSRDSCEVYLTQKVKLENTLNSTAGDLLSFYHPVR